jgi:hypothetical protein
VLDLLAANPLLTIMQPGAGFEPLDPLSRNWRPAQWPMGFYSTAEPYIWPSGSAISSRRVPSGSRKYMEVPLSSW